MKKEGFPRRIRAKKQSEFRRIIQHGSREKGENLTVFRFQHDGGEGQKFGIGIAGGIRQAVQRNRIKRTIREVLRRNKTRFAQNEGVVVVCKSTAVKARPHKLREDLQSLIRQLEAS